MGHILGVSPAFCLDIFTATEAVHIAATYIDAAVVQATVSLEV